MCINILKLSSVRYHEINAGCLRPLQLQELLKVEATSFQTLIAKDSFHSSGEVRTHFFGGLCKKADWTLVTSSVAAETGHIARIATRELTT